MASRPARLLFISCVFYGVALLNALRIGLIIIRWGLYSRLVFPTLIIMQILLSVIGIVVSLLVTRVMHHNSPNTPLMVLSGYFVLCLAFWAGQIYPIVIGNRWNWPFFILLQLIGGIMISVVIFSPATRRFIKGKNESTS
jgi:uncharacterized membrane protein